MSRVVPRLAHALRVADCHGRLVMQGGEAGARMSRIALAPERVRAACHGRLPPPGAATPGPR